MYLRLNQVQSYLRTRPLIRTFFQARYLPLTASAVLMAVFYGLGRLWPYSVVAFDTLALIAAAVTVLGVYDLFQTRHAILRNYPITAHLRFLLETIRPEMRQYFFEGEKDGLPFPRDKRAIVYQRAKKDLINAPLAPC